MKLRMNKPEPQKSRSTDQLRLALIELARIEREIDSLTPRAKDLTDLELLRSLRACRATLLRMAGVRMASVTDTPEA
jgi:hypothetical protein